MKRIPQRTCIVCRRECDKSALVRVVRKPDGEVIVDTAGTAPGRGAYVCKTDECLNNAIKRRAFNRAFKAELSDEVYVSLKASFEAIER